MRDIIENGEITTVKVGSTSKAECDSARRDWRAKLRAIHVEAAQGHVESAKRWRRMSALALVEHQDDVAAFALCMAGVQEDLAREETFALQKIDAAMAAESGGQRAEVGSRNAEVGRAA